MEVQHRPEDSGVSWGDSRGARKTTLGHWLLLSVVLVLVAIVAVALLSLRSSRAAFERQAGIAADNLARALQQAVEAEIAQFDLVLRDAVLAIDREWAGGAIDPVAVQRVLAPRRTLLPDIGALRATDAAGRARYGDGVNAENPVDLSDRDYFVRLRDTPAPQLVISEPLFGRTSHQWTVIFARRWNRPDGSFAGAVYMSVPTDHFRRILAGADLGEQGAVSLRSATMRLVARAARSGGPVDVGSVKVSEQLLEALRAQPQGGTYVARTALDQVERVNAYRAGSTYPMTVIVGLGTDEYLAPWRRQAAQVAMLAGAAALILLASAGLVHRAWRRENDAGRRLALEARRHRALLRTASDGIHVLDREGRIVELSDSFAAMLGHRRDDMLGMSVTTWDAAIPPEQTLAWCRNVDRATKFDTRHRRADGSVIDVEVTTVPVRIDGQGLIYCSARDVSLRHRLEAEVRRNLERLKDVADSVPASIIYVDRDERLQFANATFGRMLGRPVEALLGRTLPDVFGAGYAARAGSIRDALAGLPTRYAQSFAADGRTRYAESRLVPKHAADGTVEGFYSLTQDLTEHVQLERELAERTHHLAAMTAVSTDYKAVVDARACILVANRAFEDYWALPPGGAAGVALVSLYGSDYFEAALRPKIERALAGQAVRERDVYDFRLLGPRTVDLSFQPLRDEQGAVVGVVITAHDVHELVSSRDELAVTVQRLRRANESLEQFARVTSHDMREPLNTIAQFVGLIERQHAAELAPPLDRYFDFVRRGALRMKTMLDDLLLFVRIEANAGEALGSVALDDVLREVQANLASRIETGGARLDIAALPVVRGQRGWLVLLFQNVLTNALKFVAPGVTPHIRVSASRGADGQVHVVVADNGIGIATADLPRLFEPFRRLHRRQVYEGTGLGLAICRRVAEAMGGAVMLASEPGVGTRVTVVLPAAEPAASAQEAG